jgi:hypothetical protein
MRRVSAAAAGVATVDRSTALHEGSGSMSPVLLTIRGCWRRRATRPAAGLLRVPAPARSETPLASGVAALVALAAPDRRR